MEIVFNRFNSKILLFADSDKGKVLIKHKVLKTTLYY